MLYRSKAKFQYDIDQPCYQIIKSGTYSKEEQEVFKIIENELMRSKIPYQDLSHACKTELNIDFGSQSIMPHINILIPIFLKIFNIIFKDRKVYVIIDYEQGFLKEAKLNIFNYSHNGKPFGKGTSYESDQLKEIVTESDQKASYIKIELIYNKEIIEDLFEKVKFDEFIIDEKPVVANKKERKKFVKNTA